MTERDQIGIGYCQRGELSQSTWRLFQDAPMPHAAVFDAWNAVWERLLAAHNPFLRLRVAKRLDRGDDRFERILEDNPRGN